MLRFCAWIQDEMDLRQNGQSFTMAGIIIYKRGKVNKLLPTFYLFN